MSRIQNTEPLYHTALSVVDVVATTGVSTFFQLREGVHGACEIDLELVPLAALVTACGFSLSQLIVGQGVELYTGLGQLRHSVGTCGRNLGEVLL